MPYVERHISSIFNAKGSAGILERMKNPAHADAIKLIINSVDPNLLKSCADFSVCPSKAVAPFYWSYKTSYSPWIDENNFVSFLSDFKCLFFENNGGLYCDNPNEIMFSLVIVFYFDKQMHG